MVSQDREIRAGRRFGTRALAVFAVAFTAAVLFIIVLALVASSSPSLLRLDRNISHDLHTFALSHPGFTSTMRFISDLGSGYAWWLIFAVVVAWLAYRRLFRLACFVLVTGIGSSLLNSLLKVTVDRARPNLADPVAVAAGKSFPSGHSQSAIVGYGILLVVFLPVIPRRWRGVAITAAAVMTLLIGFSRIALGVHFLSDVVGAYLIGTVWLIGLISIFRAWRREIGKPPAKVAEGLEPESRQRLEP
ncbi:MAG: hypothetical protein QOK10_1993 [Pseudonocardiales bacterium]|jgi:undecaprenyl-diphosphatase|nr:hypothetical protein [Pseudonocardiales bacterium]